jgi:CBS domain containing-hemolysin-like protein
VDEMFEFFQINKTEAAMVVNEFGGVDGLVTMNGVLRFIFGNVAGDVSGQHLYMESDDNSYEVPGEMKLPDFNRLTHFGIEDPRMTTIGGVVFRHLDRLPRVGDSVTVEGIAMTVLAMDRNRIAMVKVEYSDKAEEAMEQAQPDSAEDTDT